MALNFEQLQKIWDLHKSLDDLLESLQFDHKDLKTAYGDVYEFLKEKIGISALFIETKNEKLINTVFTYGSCNEDIKVRAPQLSEVNEIVSFTTPGGLWFAQPIDVDNHIIGTIAIGLKLNMRGSVLPSTEYFAEVLNTISELIDSYTYGIHCTSIKHSMIMGLQEALADQDITTALDKATQILFQSLKFKHMLIVYTDREIITESKNIKYVYYDGYKRLHDNIDNPCSSLDKDIRNHKNFLYISPDELTKLLGIQNCTISYLTKGMDETDSIGFIAAEVKEGEKLSILAQDLLQIFSEELRQRLIDLNREKNILRKYFPNPVINQLITTNNYEERFLKTRDAEIGIIFADISGFTKMSEQILKSPERITNFVNKWAKGVVTRVFPLGATLDKLIGDCAMFLFGPPFYETSPEVLIKHMLQASQQIVNYTKSYLRMQENIDIHNHPDFEKFGVSIGVNYCHCIVGLIGPNQDLTAFSSGVNITARLQGLAGTNEILVTESVKDIATRHSESWKFSEKQSASVKNVEKPVAYYKLLSGRQE